MGEFAALVRDLLMRHNMAVMLAQLRHVNDHYACGEGMRRAQRLLLVAVSLGASLLMPGLGAAAFKLCNQSYDVLNVAIAQPSPDRPGPDAFITRGWWRVAPNQCATLLREALQSRYFYVFAVDVFGKEALPGVIPLCVAPKRFEIARQGDCLVRGFIDARFLEIDTEEQTDWTVFVSPRPS